MKNKIELLAFILDNYSGVIDGNEYSVRYFSRYKPSTQKIKERNILNIIIEESANSLVFLKILCERGADVNRIVHYNVDPGGYQHSKEYYRTPLIFAVMKKKTG